MDRQNSGSKYYGQIRNDRLKMTGNAMMGQPRPASGPYRPVSTLGSNDRGVPSSAEFAKLLEPMSPNAAGWRQKQDVAILRALSVSAQTQNSTVEGRQLAGNGFSNRTESISHAGSSVSKATTNSGSNNGTGASLVKHPDVITIDDSPQRVNSSRSSGIGYTPDPAERSSTNSWPNKRIISVPTSNNDQSDMHFTPEDYRYMSSADVANSLKDIIVSAYAVNEKHDITTETDHFVEGLNVKLLDHQVAGLKFLLSREGNDIKHKGGMLCDDMGLGKTVQSIALMLSHKKDKDVHTSKNACKCTLVVAPLALINQWATEIKTKAPSLSVLIYHGQSRTKSEIMLRKYDVVITTYQLVASENQIAGPLFKLDWWRIILDEAHTIKNKSSQSAQAACALHGLNRWALTGTPLQNNIDELHSLFKFLHIPPLSDPAFWTDKISRPAAAGRGKLAMKRLQVVLAQVMLRRTKDVLVESGMKLPKRVVHKSTVILTGPERAFYDNLEQKMGNKMQALIGEGGQKYMSVLLMLLRLRQACNHTAIVASKLSENKTAVTPPSSDPKNIVNKPTATRNEIDDLVDLLGNMTVDIRKCTICQTDLSTEESKERADFCEYCRSIFVSQGIGATTPSSKIVTLLSLLKSDPMRKTIVFSQFTTMLDIVEPFLQDDGIAFVRYDGSMRPQQRVRSLEMLANDSQVTVLLCSLKCGALGLNLTCASRVVLVDPWWNPMVSEQAIDRVHRIGQTRDVDVYEITAENTVEERILKLQEQKMQLARGVMDDKAGKLNVNRLTREEILFLFNRPHDTQDV
ncbi:SNF2 family N-terminal domain-containing protein [Lipomyces kononenkoae]